MSRTIDEKVVEMRFDNSDFERNVSQSMSTLDKLKGALDFSGASKAFDGITSAANKVSLGGLTGALDGVSEKFSALETIATGALLNIGRKVEDFVSNQIKSLTLEPVMEGFDKYASKTSSVQMIMNAIRDGTKSDAELMEEVNGQLERLMWYTDETSYDFTEMTASIGKFTSAGIGLEEAVTAMEGIANLAGISGATKQEANRAMYNISQALSGGFMRLQDWKSIENANMATKEFKEMLIKAAIDRGTLEEAVDEAGNTIWGFSTKSGFNEVNYKTVASTLTEGKWLTNEVLTDTLAMYGAFTDELSKVYDDINENADVTTSQIIKMTNQWKEGTLDMSEAMAMTGKSAEELEAIFASLGRDEYDLGRRAFAAAQEAKTFREAIDATKDAVSTGWMKTFELLFGNYEEAKVLWTDLANELWDIFAGPISDINDVLTAWRNNDDLGDGRDDLIEGLKNIYRAARSVVDPITEAWEAIFPSATYQDIWNFTHRFKEFTDGLIVGETSMKQIKMVFEDFFGIFKTFSTAFKNGGGFGKFFEGIGGAFKTGTDRLYDFLLGIQRIRSVIADYESGNLGEFSFVQQTIDAYPAAAKALDIYEKLVKTAETLGQAFGKTFDTTKFFENGVLTINSVIGGIEQNIANVLSAITEVVHIWTGADISKTIDNVRAILFGLLDGIKAFLGSERWTDVKNAIVGIADAFKDAFGPAWRAAVAIFDDWIAGIRTLISGADGDFSGFFDTIVKGANWVADFVRSWKGGVEFISEFLTKFLSLTDAIEVYQANGGGILGILAVINDKLRIVIDTFADLVQNVTGFDIHGIGDSILDVIQGISYAVLQLADTIAKTFGWKDNPFGKLLGSINEGFGGPEGKGFDLSGIFDRVGDAFSRFGELVNKVAPGISVLLRTVGDAFKNLWELIGQIRLEDLIRIFQGIASIMLMFQGKKTLAELGDTLEAYQKKLKADMLFAIAGSILMIAGAALIISKIDAEKIGLVLGTLGVSFAGLIGMMVASKWANPKALAALPGTVLAIAAAMVILAKAAEMMTGPIQAFANMKDFWAGMGRLGTVMGSFGLLLTVLGALNNSGAVGGASKALGRLTGVLALMLPLILAYSKIDFKKLAAGLGQMVLPIILLGGSLTLISKFASNAGDVGSALLKFAGALAIMAGVMLIMDKLDAEAFWSSLGKLAVGLIALTAGIAAFSFSLAIIGPVLGLLDKFASSLLKLGTAILFISAGVGLLGIIATILGDSAQAIAEAGVGLIVTVLDAIVARTPEIAEDIVLFILGVLDAVADHTPEIVSACIRIVGGIAEGVKDAMANGGIDIGELLGGGGLLAGILAVVLLLKKAKLGAKDFFNAGLALVGAAALLVEIGALFYGIGQLSALVGGPSGLEKFGEFSSALTSALMSNHGGMLILIVALLTLVTVLSVIIGKLELGEKDMASNLGKAFLVLAQLFGEVVGLIAELGILFTAFGALSDFVGAPAKIAAFGELCSAIVDFFLGVDENGSPHAGVAILVAACAGLLVLFDKLHLSAAGIGAFGSVVAIIAEVAGVIEAMGLIFALGGQINEWIEMIPGIGEGGIVKRIEEFGALIIAIADVVGGLIGHLLGSVVGGIAGGAVEETLKGLGDGLAYIGDKAGGFFEIMTNMGPEVLEGCANFGEMAVSLGKATILDAIGTFLGGKEKYKKFADGISELGPGLKKFADSVDGINVSAVEKAGVCGSIITALAKDVPNEGGLISVLTGDNNIATFGANLAEFGKGLYKYAFYAQNIDTAAVDATSSCIETLAKVAKDLPNEGGLVSVFSGNNDFATFGENLASFGVSLFTYSAYAVQTNNNIGALTSVGKVVESLGDAATVIDSVSNVKDITKFGENVVKFGNKLKEYGKIASEINVDDVNAVTSAVTNILDTIVAGDSDTFNSKIEEVGSKILDGVLGLFGTADSEKKTKEASDKILTYICDKFKENASVSEFSVAITKMVSDAIGEDELKEGLKTAGNGIVTEIQNGITESFEGEEGLSAKFASFLESLLTSIATDGQNGTKTRYYNAGADLIKSLMNGMLNEEKISGFGSPAALQLKEGFKALLDSLIGLIVSEEMQGQFNRGGASLINAMLGGIKSVDVETEMKSVGKNATLGYANGMVDQEALKQVAKSAKAATDVGINTAKTNLAEKSPSRVTMLIGQYFTQGFANGIYDKIPNAKEAVLTLMQKVKEGMGQNDLISLANKLGLNLDGALDDHIANLISQHGLDDFLNGNLDEMANSIMGALSNGEIYSGGGTESWDAWMSSFQTEYENSIPDLESMAQGVPEVFGTTMQEYANNGSVTNGANAIMDNVSGVLSECYDASGNYGYGTVYNYADNMLTASEEIQPVLATATENMTAPVEDGLAEMLSYAEWVAKKYPEGLTKDLSVPTTNFDELYENMKGGQLEAILNMFDAMSDTDRSKLIRAYGLGEEGGNADLANYLQWYWNNEPTRMQNLESIKQATEGYQAYLDEQKALQEAQAIQSQKNYEGVQQIAAGMNERADAADAKYMAAIEEIKMTVKSIEEELDSVHADIAELNNMDVYIDSSALVGATAEKYNEELGNMAKIGRRRVTR